MSFGTHKCSRKRDPGQADSCALYSDKTIRYNPIGMIGAIKIGSWTILGGVLLVIGVSIQGGWSLRSKDRRRCVPATLWNGRSRFWLPDRRHRLARNLGCFELLTSVIPTGTDW